ncbi:hypothetical protein TraAM80_08323 [Trypanosoma rangeli]|uniref:DNA repair protein Rad9 n=1 Tax=Trypanosoma rangeli TaxID=5698 RepID=A0A422N160_TRYRA|nr:uncharacterized protein TraAM80_08323 [Trypanosoma rangeli]RNE99197.1 hypothetical protein TraAM80_08323 [Trypanosoma rangeli]|eukprot:RNE99197.1 hypothetical protein TraAM80_08323 [Trypanosoma rangeli]
MFLSFSITGASVRPFMHLLQTVCKQGEGIFFEPHQDVLQLRAVNSTRSTHMLVSIAACHLEGYHYIHGNSAANSSGQEGSPTSETNPSRHNDINGSGESFLLLPTKALTVTVLRQSQGLCAVHVHYDATSASDMAACDALQWECVLSCGTTKKFGLPLAEGRPERAFFAPERFGFDACAAAWLWGALLAWFPASRPRVVMQPLKSRLELWVVDNGEADIMEGAQPPLDGGKSGGAETKVVASQDHFLFMQQYEPHDGEPHRGSATASREKSGVDEACGAAGASEVLLPGKIIEMKPFKQVCLLADQLGMMIRVRTGVEGLPVFVEAITVQAAQQAAALAIKTATKDAAASAVSVFSGNGVAAMPQNMFGRHPVPVENSFQVTFSMYIAAFDVPQRVLDGGEGFTATNRHSTNSVTTVTGEDRGVGTASEMHEVGAPVASTYVAPLSPDAAPALAGAPQALPTITASATAGPAVILEGATNGADPAKNNVCSPPGVLVSASLNQGPSGLFDGPSQVDASPSHSNGRTLFSPGGEIVVRATPDAPTAAEGRASTPRRGGKRCRGGETVDGKSPQQSIVSCTAGVTTAMSVAQSASFVAPTNVSSSDRTQAGLQQREEELMLSGSAKPPVETRFPLDFNAFMQEIAEEAKEDEEPSEEDEDLQRFLESCMSLFVRPETPATQPQ